jgi:uncharacterized protein (UPF0548 family)
LSYGPIGIAKDSSRGFKVDEARAVIGQGFTAFTTAKNALRNWKQFDLGWVELYPQNAPLETGTVVAVLVRHLRFWSLNGCRIVYLTGDDNDQTAFGFAYGTLGNHAELGEEIFEVSFDPESHEVSYRIRAVSKPRAALALAGYPITRLFQARFRRDSIDAMKRWSQYHAR